MTPTPSLLGPHSSVAVLIPHFRCEQWLTSCLESMLDQTRRPDAIIVIDDASAVPPADIVSRFPTVTLLTAATNVGPYRLIQQVIDDTEFEVYMFQDADDWSSPRRLEILLEEAERIGTELVGCQEIRLHRDGLDAYLHVYPHDPAASYQTRPRGYPLLHASCIVSRRLVQELGGYATGMRFSGDSEFLRRAVHATRVVNVPHVCYFRRQREGSLVSAPETAAHSPARKAVRLELARRSTKVAEQIAQGQTPDLSPYAVAPPVVLQHLLGPDPRSGGAKMVPTVTTRSAEALGNETGAAPVFIFGAAHSSAGLVLAALAQHPRLTAVAAADTCEKAIREGRSISLADILGDHCCVERLLDGSPSFCFIAPALAKLFPRARFVHVVCSPDEVGPEQLSEGQRKRDDSTLANALEDWLRHRDAGLDAERNLPKDAVVHVDRATLLSDPPGTLQRLLNFIGEPYDVRCLRPFADTQTVRMAPMSS